MTEDLNRMSIEALDFMGRYAGLEVDINDGRIVDQKYDSPVAGTAGESE